MDPEGRNWPKKAKTPREKLGDVLRCLGENSFAVVMLLLALGLGAKR
jgi:hypothetical protein